MPSIPVSVLDFILGLCKKERWGHVYKVVGHSGDPASDLGALTQDVHIDVHGAEIVTEFHFQEAGANAVVTGVINIPQHSVDVKLNGASQANPRIGVHPLIVGVGVRLAVSLICDDAQGQRVEYRCDCHLV